MQLTVIVSIILALVWFPSWGWGACSWTGNTGTLGGTATTDFDACISDASSKTGAVIVTIPAGSHTWATYVAVDMSSGFANVTSLTIQGAGSLPTTCANAANGGFSLPSSCGAATSGGTSIAFTGGGFRITGTSGKKWRITNLALSGSPASNYALIQPTGTSKPSNGGGWRVDHITSRSVTGQLLKCSYVGDTAGVIDHIDHIGAVQFSNWAHLTYGGNSLWATDPTQQDMIVMEDNYIESTAMPVVKMLADGSYGASIILRYNAIKDYYIGGHDLSSDARSIRRYEVYGNELYHTGSTGGITSAFVLRGGDGVFYSNKLTFPGTNPFSQCTVGQGGHGICLDNYRSNAGLSQPQGGWPAVNATYCDGTPEYMCVGNYWSNAACDPESASACSNVQANCQAIDTNTNGSGSCRDQIGRGTNQAASPMLFWGNTASINGGSYAWASVIPRQLDYVTTHIVADSDYCDAQSVMPTTCGGVATAYTPYTYPHPLRGEATITYVPWAH